MNDAKIRFVTYLFVDFFLENVPDMKNAEKAKTMKSCQLLIFLCKSNMISECFRRYEYPQSVMTYLANFLVGVFEENPDSYSG